METAEFNFDGASATSYMVKTSPCQQYTPRVLGKLLIFFVCFGPLLHKVGKVTPDSQPTDD